MFSQLRETQIAFLFYFSGIYFSGKIQANLK